MTERLRPQAHLTPAPPEPRSLWGPIVTAMPASLALAFSTCAISAQFDAGVVSRVLWRLYAVCISIFLCFVVFAANYFLIGISRKVRSK